MDVADFLLKCSDCDKIIGGLSLVYIGVPHHLKPLSRCIECLSKVDLSSLTEEQRRTVKAWLEEYKLEQE